MAGYIAEVKRALPPGFAARGDLYVFVDECHRTQSGDLHRALTAILPNALFVGFTGTPLLKADKQKSVEVFGRYIHTYKFDEAVKDGVVLDLRYEARDIDQRVTSQRRIDEWFEAKTMGLTYCLQVKVLSHMSSTRISAARGGKGSVAAYTPYFHEPFAPTHGCRYAMRLMRLCNMAAIRLA